MAILVGVIAAGTSSGASAQVTSSDDFTQANDMNSWKTFDGACLTAGDGTGSIPPCVGLPYYGNQIQIGGNSGYLGQTTVPSSGNTETPDPAGSGALRFTNWYTQAGSIISSGAPFPTGAGLQVVFKTISYLGDSGGAGGDGADGMGFFLMDGGALPYDTGAFGGSLGYTCSNQNNDGTIRADGTPRQYDGLAHAYLGLGIDEYGNFLNPGDNTASGPGYQPGRIGLRGAGSIAWGPLSNNFPAQYPSLPAANALTLAQQASAVRDTCRTGHIWDYSNAAAPVDTGVNIPDYAPVGSAVIFATIPSFAGNKIANEAAATRGAAQPITYNLKITQDGILSLAISYNGGNYIPVITQQSITASNGALPASFRFGFTGSTGGSRNVHEILCFQAAPSDVSGTGVGVNEQEATKIASGTQAYLAYYYPGDSTGRLTANTLNYQAGTGSTPATITINPTANWDASCNLTGILTGNTCPSTGVAGVVAPQAPTSRVMLTWNAAMPTPQGTPFEWNTITAAQQNTLDAGDTPPFNSNRLAYLRGDRTNEINTSGVGLFRARDAVLGDIVDSSPTWVGPPTTHYAITWHDQLVATDPTPENSGTQTFPQYVTAQQTRLNVVYAGSNDGFMHGFRSGSFDTGGNYVNNAATPNDGQEVVAFMPSAVLNTIHNAGDPTLDFANSQYAHNFFVDATPDQDDLYYQGVWHTWLVGGLGAGGADIYALDVTNPNNFSESNASSLVMGEWSSSTIGCTNVGNCGINMGNTYGSPIVRRMHDGNWAIIFGNGFGSTTGDAGIFVVLIDSNGNTQAANTYYLSTGTGTGSVATPCVNPTSGPITCNGIAYVSSADLDGDHITDYVYAGDLLGNVWRFDLTSAVEGNWAAASAPLFTAPAGQPITTRIQVISVPQGSGPARVMIDFGTGQKFPPTILVPTTYQAGVQYLYGIWDWNMSNWNSISATKYLSIAAGSTLTPANLTTQVLSATGTINTNYALNVTSNVVCWASSTTCGSGNTQFGWDIALLGVQEQVVFNPLIYQNSFLVNTTIPAVNTALICNVPNNTGNTIGINLATGGSLGTGTGSFFLNAASTTAAGSQTNGTGTPFIAQAGGNTFILTQSLGGASFTVPSGVAPPVGSPLYCVQGSKICSGSIQAASLTSKRLTWIERR
jgi:type IV pilus assembly protein PilY1